MKKDSLYTEIDLEAIMNQLEPGEVMEIDEVYLGREKKFVSRLLIYKLTQEQTQERLAIRDYFFSAVSLMGMRLCPKK